jgi:hypothetical protein
LEELKEISVFLFNKQFSESPHALGSIVNIFRASSRGYSKMHNIGLCHKGQG